MLIVVNADLTLKLRTGGERWKRSKPFNSFVSLSPYGTFNLFCKFIIFLFGLEKMSDDGCCGDTGGDCGDTGGCCDDTGGGSWCDDSAPCIDTAACEATTEYVETSFSNGGDVYISPPDEIYDGGYCYEDTTCQPVYSSLSRSNGTDDADCCGRVVIIFAVIVIAVIVICKLNMQYLYVWTSLYTNSL